MSYPFAIEDEIDVDASPEEVWRALTIGRRMDSWFTGRSEIDPRVGGTVRVDFDGFVLESRVIACEPPRRLAYRGSEGLEGDYMEFEWRICARMGGGSTVHFMHRGRLAGEDPPGQVEALKKGDPMYLRKLACYLEYFNGQTAVHNVIAEGPAVADTEQFWSILKSALRLRARVHEWDPVRATLDGLGTIEGVADYVTPEFLGVRTSTALYRFIHGPGGAVVVEYHDFEASENGHANADAWRAWLAKSFG